MAAKIISKDTPWISGTSISYVRRMKLKHHKGKKANLAQNMRRMNKEGCKSHFLHIKYKTTTPLAALMRKWPWTVVAQQRLQCKSLDCSVKAYQYVPDETEVLRMQSQPSKCRIRIFVFKYKRKIKIHVWGSKQKKKEKTL